MNKQFIKLQKRKIVLFISIVFFVLFSLIFSAIAKSEMQLSQRLSIIESEAFRGDSKLEGFLEIPNSVVRIEDDAFTDTGIYAIDFPWSVEFVGSQTIPNIMYYRINRYDMAFSDTAFISANYIIGFYNRELRNWAEKQSIMYVEGFDLYQQDGFYYQKRDNGMKLLSAVDNKNLPDHIIIPEFVNDIRVTEITDFAFLSCDSILSLKIPESLRETVQDKLPNNIDNIEFYSRTNNLTIGTQDNGTVDYTYANAIKQCIQTIPSYSVSLISDSSGQITSPLLVQRGDCDITISKSVSALLASTIGIESASLPICPNVRCIAGGFGNDFINVMFTYRFVYETGIDTIEELVEKQQPVRLIIKRNGTYGELVAEHVFNVFDIDINNPPQWLTVEKTSGGAIKDGLSDDLYDMTIDHIGVGQANTTELCLDHPMFQVQLSDSTLDALCSQGYNYVSIPAQTWYGQNREILSVGSQQCIIVSSEMDDEVAYNITKALCENREILANTSTALANFNPEVSGSKALTGCELHPGAARYYQEMGWAYH